MAKWADMNPALALREYNKRQPNAYSGTGPSDEEIKAAMAANTQDGGYSLPREALTVGRNGYGYKVQQRANGGAPEHDGTGPG